MAVASRTVRPWSRRPNLTLCKLSEQVSLSLKECQGTICRHERLGCCLAERAEPTPDEHPGHTTRNSPDPKVIVAIRRNRHACHHRDYAADNPYHGHHASPGSQTVSRPLQRTAQVDRWKGRSFGSRLSNLTVRRELRRELRNGVSRASGARRIRPAQPPRINTSSHGEVPLLTVASNSDTVNVCWLAADNSSATRRPYPADSLAGSGDDRSDFNTREPSLVLPVCSSLTDQGAGHRLDRWNTLRHVLIHPSHGPHVEPASRIIAVQQVSESSHSVLNALPVMVAFLALGKMIEPDLSPHARV